VSRAFVNSRDSLGIRFVPARLVSVTENRFLPRQNGGVANRRAPRCARQIIYFLPGIGRPEIYLSTVSLLAGRPTEIQSRSERPAGSSSRLVSRCSSHVRRRQICPPRNKPLDDFEPWWFLPLVCLVRYSASQ